MSADYGDIPPTPVGTVVFSFIGLACLSFLYGLFGAFITLLRFLRFGPKRFFNKTARPKPPLKAMDPIHGTHDMIKLKVFVIN
jgi:hypothetical protein